MQIKFCGQTGTILEKSPHGNYLVVELSDEITICGTYTNIWSWDEFPEVQSNFIAFITYIAIDHDTNLEDIYQIIENHNGYFKEGESEPRTAKRNPYYPLELKVRGLKPDAVIELIKYFK
jgi:hypothetical protein